MKGDHSPLLNIPKNPFCLAGVLGALIVGGSSVEPPSISFPVIALAPELTEYEDSCSHSEPLVMLEHQV